MGFVRWPRRVARLVDLGGRDILDVGCGTTLHSIGFLTAGAKAYTGLDPTLDLDAKAFKSKVTHQFEPTPFSLRELTSTEPRITYWMGITEGLVAAGKRFDVATLHNVTEHVDGLNGLLETLTSLLKPGGHLVIHHHNFYCWDGHHCAPETEELLDLDNQEQRLVVDWAHLKTVFPEDHYVSRGLNRITLDELHALLIKYFVIDVWEEKESPPGRGRGRFHLLEENIPQGMTRRDLAVKNVLTVCTLR